MSDLMYEHPRLFTILHMEDVVNLHEDIAYLLMLFYQPTSVVWVNNGHDVLPQALAHQPDLIISDMAHPGLWGHLVFADVRRHPHTAHIPYIFLSANEQSRFASTLYESDLRPPEGYILKPFKPETLRATLYGVFPFMTGKWEHLPSD